MKVLAEFSPTSSVESDLTLLPMSGQFTRVDGGPEPPDVVPVDAEIGEDVRFVVEIVNHSGTSQQTLGLHHLHKDNFCYRFSDILSST